MTEQAPREVEHEITVQAPATEVYRLLAEVENWPRLFPPSVYVDYAEKNGNEERIRIWATANGEAKNWTSRRTLDPEGLRITFRQEVSAPPVAEMSGTWIIEARGASETRVRLLHTYRAIDDDPEGLDWIDKAVDRNSRAELPALKENLELAAESAGLTLSFEDSVRIDGSAKDAFDFVNEAQLWTERLPHVHEVRLTEDSPGVQTLRMDTVAKDGSTHTTESVRICFPHHRIAYKQTTLPALMTLHTGYWQFDEQDDGGTVATSQHTVVVNTANITAILGPDAGVPEARAFLREALGTNSRATLGHAKAFAEARR
ncbi:aromatase/cyclase [Streptomyces sp. BE308]|uniref:aromatase/cyclase n=1 Tax=unclassified Streptomyces TaxID=2593676 RepID=UPI002DDBFDFE|nr:MULTISPECIES: aromatase/cyclase [unclassified Streptomyces]MEE1796927.1 aromatase/cyclase [Streptomyces sp. BE308]WRZ75028.1 aromatase/cyclase [Streptomyces sp. NBC_01237]